MNPTCGQDDLVLSSKNFFLERFDQFQTPKNDLETQNFEIFDKVVHDFGKSDKIIIQWKNAYF